MASLRIGRARSRLLILPVIVVLMASCAQPDTGEQGATRVPGVATQANATAPTLTPLDATSSSTTTAGGTDAAPAAVLKDALLPLLSTPGMTITDSGTGGEGAYGGLVMGFGAFGSGDTACRELFKPHGLVSTFAYQSMTGRQAFFFESVESYVSEEEATQVLDNLESALSPCTEFTVQLDAGTMRFSYSLVRLSGGTSDTDELAHLMLGIGESSGRAIYIKQVRMGGEVLLFVLPSTEESVSYGDDAESRFIDVIGAYRAEHPRG